MLGSLQLIEHINLHMNSKELSNALIGVQQYVDCIIKVYTLGVSWLKNGPELALTLTQGRIEF